jgi:hypothetical protein
MGNIINHCFVLGSEKRTTLSFYPSGAVVKTGGWARFNKLSKSAETCFLAKSLLSGYYSLNGGKIAQEQG